MRLNIAAVGAAAAAAAAAALVARALSRRTVVRHLVHIALKPDAPLKDILTEGDKMAAAMPHLIIGYERGVQCSPEPHTKGYDICCIITFRSEAERDQYLGNQAHTQFICVWIAPNCTDICVGDFVLTAPRWKFWWDALAY